MEQIKMCPFCGSENVKLSDYKNYVLCDDCRGFGPTSNNPDNAILLWNAAANQIEALRNKVEVLNKNLIETTDRAMIAELQRDEARRVARKLYHFEPKWRRANVSTKDDDDNQWRDMDSYNEQLINWIKKAQP